MAQQQWTHNFSAGPGALPAEVLQEAQQAIQQVPGVGLSVLGISHRSDWFRSIVDETEANIRALLGVPAHYHVLFLQGGATLQFTMLAKAMLQHPAHQADYLCTGYWSDKAVIEGQKEGNASVLWSGAAQGFSQLPDPAALAYSPEAKYLHYVSNESVEGLQFSYLPGLDGIPRVCDMSSDLLSRPVDVNQYALIYAHAQKNLGPAGVTVVIVRDDVVTQAPTGLPAMLDYKEHVRMGSIYNTPPVFAIYVMCLVTRWLLHQVGGLGSMNTLNQEKAAMLYAQIDGSNGFYQGHAHKKDRSIMNVTFKLPSASLETDFLTWAEQQGLYGLEGHRSLGGVRASLYNAVTLNDVRALCEVMGAFCERHKNVFG